MRTVNVGVIGVGNCASSLVQGVEYYSREAGSPAELNALCAGYAVSDRRARVSALLMKATPRPMSETAPLAGLRSMIDR